MARVHLKLAAVLVVVSTAFVLSRHLWLDGTPLHYMMWAAQLRQPQRAQLSQLPEPQQPQHPQQQPEEPQQPPNQFRGCKPYPNKRVVLLTVNEHYLDFFENWLLHAEPFWDLRHTQLVVAAESLAVAPILHNKSHHSLLPFEVVLDKNWTWLQTGKAFFKHPFWSNVVVHRARQIGNLVAAGCHVLYVDVDSVWRKPVFPILDQRIESVPHLLISDKDFAGCKPRHHDLGYLCTCFMYFSPTPGNVDLLAKYDKASMKDKTEDQRGFNTALGKNKSVASVLPYEQFPPGACAEPHIRTAVVVHANYIKGLEQKRAFLQRLGLWNATPSTL